MGQDERSGRNQEWVNKFPDITAEDWYKYLDDLSEMPLLRCNGSPGCESYAQWSVSFHGCTLYVTCPDHKKLWEIVISAAIESNGYIACEVCGTFFITLSRTMQWRAI